MKELWSFSSTHNRLMKRQRNNLIERYGVCLIIWRAGKTKTKWKGYGNIQPQASDQWTTVSAARMQHCSSCKVWRASRSLWPGTLHCVVVWFVTRTLLSLEPGFASSTNQRYNLKDFCGWLKGLSGPMATLLMLPFTGPYKEFNAEGYYQYGQLVHSWPHFFRCTCVCCCVLGIMVFCFKVTFSPKEKPTPKHHHICF